MKIRAAGLLLTAALCSGPAALAQDRPSESQMFGGPPAEEPAKPAEEPAAPAQPAPAEEGESRHNEAEMFGGSAPTPSTGRPNEAEMFSGSQPTAAEAPAAASSSNAPTNTRELMFNGDNRPMFSEEPAPDDPLQIGGQIYLRLQSTANEHTKPQSWGIGSPTLLDVFFDARPNDRVRGFVRGRMTYDPLLPSSSNGLSSTSLLGNSGTAGSTSISPLYTGAGGSPTALLDQLWLRFDIAHQLFVTVGKQHVRWGTGRFWTPADYLHLRRRNPLDQFDVRTGTNMVKLHLPLESLNWNFYGYGVLENNGGRPDLGTPAGALRAEFVLDQFELGLGVYNRARSRAKMAADVSFGIWDIDFYAELALRDGREFDRVSYNPNAVVMPPMSVPGAPAEVAQALALAQIQSEVDAIYPVYRQTGYRPQLVAGLSYSIKYAANDILTIGVEYFYNGQGYDNSNVYSGLLYPHSQALLNPASFFYLGRHYGALFISLPSPFNLDLHTFTLSTLGNLSDKSFTTRFDYAYTLLTHLRFEAYASMSYGDRGEFRFQIADLPSVPVSTSGLPRPTVVALGLGLRLSI